MSRGILDFGFWMGEYLARQGFLKSKSCQHKPEWYKCDRQVAIAIPKVTNGNAEITNA